MGGSLRRFRDPGSQDRVSGQGSVLVPRGGRQSRGLPGGGVPWAAEGVGRARPVVGWPPRWEPEEPGAECGEGVGGDPGLGWGGEGLRRASGSSRSSASLSGRDAGLEGPGSRRAALGRLAGPWGAGGLPLRPPHTSREVLSGPGACTPRPRVPSGSAFRRSLGSSGSRGGEGGREAASRRWPGLALAQGDPVSDPGRWLTGRKQRPGSGCHPGPEGAS